MIHANAFAANPRFAEDDQLLTGGDHFLDVMQIEPAAEERLAQRVGIRLLQGCLENFLPATEATNRGFNHFAAQAHRHIAFLAREAWKLVAIFVPPRVMGQQIFDCLDCETAKPEQLGPRDPIEFLQRLGDVDHARKTPNPKPQIPNKSQAPIIKCAVPTVFGAWDLVLLWCLGFWIWDFTCAPLP